MNSGGVFLLTVLASLVSLMMTSSTTYAAPYPRVHGGALSAMNGAAEYPASANNNQRDFRSRRGFKNFELSTARGFGKRSSSTDAIQNRYLSTAIGFGKRASHPPALMVAEIDPTDLMESSNNDPTT